MSYDFSKVIKTAQAVSAQLPTDKQVKFATQISAALNIPLPEANTKHAYTQFISEYLLTYQEYVASDPDNEEDGIYNCYDGPYY